MQNSYFSEQHHELIDECVRYGLSIGLRTDRTDRIAAKKAVIAHYKSCGLSPPNDICWFESPYACVKALASARDEAPRGYHTETWRRLVGKFDSLKSGAIPRYDPNVPEDIRTLHYDLKIQLDQQIWYFAGNELSKNVRKRTRLPFNAVNSHIGAHFNARHAAEIYALEKLQKYISPEMLSFRRATELLWWWYPGEKIAYLSEPPVALHLAHEPHPSQMHCATGKAIEFADGTGFSAWRGEEIPDKWLTGHPPTPAEAISRRNDNQRAIACEIVGWQNIFNALEAREIDRNLDQKVGTEWEINLPKIGPQRFLDFVDKWDRRKLLLIPQDIGAVLKARAALHL